MNDQVKIKGMVRTNKVGSECYFEMEYDKEDYQSMSEEDIEQDAFEAALSEFDWDFWVEE